MEECAFWPLILNKSKPIICAPMVEQSDRPFREFTQDYGIDLAFSPMIYASNFVSNAEYREEILNDLKGSRRPLVV